MALIIPPTRVSLLHKHALKNFLLNSRCLVLVLIPLLLVLLTTGAGIFLTKIPDLVLARDVYHTTECKIVEKEDVDVLNEGLFFTALNITYQTAQGVTYNEDAITCIAQKGVLIPSPQRMRDECSSSITAGETTECMYLKNNPSTVELQSDVLLYQVQFVQTWGTLGGLLIALGFKILLFVFLKLCILNECVYFCAHKYYKHDYQCCSATLRFMKSLLPGYHVQDVNTDEFISFYTLKELRNTTKEEDKPAETEHDNKLQLNSAESDLYDQQESTVTPIQQKLLNTQEVSAFSPHSPFYKLFSLSASDSSEVILWHYKPSLSYTFARHWFILLILPLLVLIPLFILFLIAINAIVSFIDVVTVGIGIIALPILFMLTVVVIDSLVLRMWSYYLTRHYFITNSRVVTTWRGYLLEYEMQHTTLQDVMDSRFRVVSTHHGIGDIYLSKSNDNGGTTSEILALESVLDPQKVHSIIQKEIHDEQ